MLRGYICIIILFIIFLVIINISINKTNIINKKNKISGGGPGGPKIITIGYDFDDCLKNFKTKKSITPVVDNMVKDHKNGNRVIIITARGDRGVPEIREFLEKINLNEDKIKIYPTGSKLDSRKSIVINNEKVDIFYDDQPGFLDEIIKNCDHKIQLYQIHPNNEDNYKILPYP